MGKKAASDGLPKPWRDLHLRGSETFIPSKAQLLADSLVYMISCQQSRISSLHLSSYFIESNKRRFCGI